jgi:hypothetical protein
MLGNKWKSVVHLLHMEMVYYYKMSQNVEIVSNLRPRKILAEGSTHRLSTLTFGRTFSLFTSLKLQKRLMFGRAKFDLLRQRVLYHA